MQHKFYAAIIAIVMVILFSGCDVLKITSNKNAGYVQTINKLYITINGSTSSKNYLQYLSEYLGKGLNQVQVTNTIHFSDPLALEGKDAVNQKINDYHPDAVMQIVQTERKVVSDITGFERKEKGVTLDIQLFVPGNEVPVWRALFIAEANITFTGVSDIAGSSAKKIIAKMRADGLIK